MKNVISVWMNMVESPFHIHCDNCNINIGTNNIEKGISILENYHEKGTYIEFYDNKIQYTNKKNI